MVIMIMNLVIVKLVFRHACNVGLAWLASVPSFPQPFRS